MANELSDFKEEKDRIDSKLKQQKRGIWGTIK